MAAVRAPTFVHCALLTLVSAFNTSLCHLRGAAEFVMRKRLMIFDPRSPIIHGVVVVTVAGLFLLVVWAEFPPDSTLAMVVVTMMIAHTILAVLMVHARRPMVDRLSAVAFVELVPKSPQLHD